MTARQIATSLFHMLPDSLQHRVRRYRERVAHKENLSAHNFAKQQHPLDATDSLSVSFHTRGPWYTEFEVNGRKYGGTNSYKDDRRVADFREWAQPHGRVLELGSFEGIHTLMLSAIPEVTSLLGLEGRHYLIRKSKFIKRVFEIDKAEFALCDFETDSFRRYGRFDFVFCSGVLYHMTRPWDFIGKMCEVTDRVFIATHIADRTHESREGFDGMVHGEGGYGEPLSGLGTYSFWLTAESLQDAFRQVGFSQQRSRVIPEWPNGTWVNAYFTRDAARWHNAR